MGIVMVRNDDQSCVGLIQRYGTKAWLGPLDASPTVGFEELLQLLPACVLSVA